jgi:hypothetical protein
MSSLDALPEPGTLLQTRWLHPLARRNVIGPRKAMAEALAAYLLSLTFRVRSEVRGVCDTEFKLKAVQPQWPDSDVELNYPAASIIEVAGTAREAHSFTPTPIEETLGQFDDLAMPGVLKAGQRTVLWKESEASVTFQVDFWNDEVTDREAVEAGIDQAFAPTETRYGVLLAGMREYYGRPVRATLENAAYLDETSTVFEKERRLRASIRCEMDVVSLRVGSLIIPDVQICVDVVDPNDPTNPAPTEA